MKKIFITLLLAIMVVGVFGCAGANENGDAADPADQSLQAGKNDGANGAVADGDGTVNESSGQDTDARDAENMEAVNYEEEFDEVFDVDKGLLNVEVTVPAYFADGEDIETLRAEAKAEGIDGVTQNSDGSITYKMSRSRYNELMKEFEDNILLTIEDILSDDFVQSIKDITYNKSYTEFTVTVDQAVFENSFDGFAMLGLGMSGMFYQLFDGNLDGNITINMKNEDTGDIFETIVFPDDFEDLM